MGEYLFVYGTLRSEFSNSYALRLRDEAQLAGPATVRGSIFRITHYPGFRQEPDGEVKGELYLLNTPAATLQALDEYEGGEYQRTEITVSTGAFAWIYQYAVQPPVSARILSGDFVHP